MAISSSRPDNVGPPVSNRSGTVPSVSDKNRGQRSQAGRKQPSAPPKQGGLSYSSSQMTQSYMPPFVGKTPSYNIGFFIRTFESMNAFAAIIIRQGFITNKTNLVTFDDVVNWFCFVTIVSFFPNYVGLNGRNYTDDIKEIKALLPNFCLPKIFVWIFTVVPIGYNRIIVNVGPANFGFVATASRQTRRRFEQIFPNINAMTTYVESLSSRATRSNLEMSYIPNLADKYIGDFILFSPLTVFSSPVNYYAFISTNDPKTPFLDYHYMMLVLGFRFPRFFTDRFFLEANLDKVDVQRFVQDMMRKFNHENTNLASFWPFGPPDSNVSRSSVVTHATDGTDKTDSGDVLPIVPDFSGLAEYEKTFIMDVLTERDPQPIVYGKDNVIKRITFDEFLKGGFRVTINGNIFKGAIDIPKLKSEARSDIFIENLSLSSSATLFILYIRKFLESFSLNFPKDRNKNGD